jgi:hypothetical protein
MEGRAGCRNMPVDGWSRTNGGKDGEVRTDKCREECGAEEGERNTVDAGG